MPKRSLYAWLPRPFRFLNAVLLALSGAHAAFAQPVDRPPCAECIAVLAPAGQAALAARDLQGLEILVRKGEDIAAVRAALDGIRAAGGRPGLWIEGVPASPADPQLAAAANRIVLDVASEGPASDELAFRLKTHLTEVRSAAAGIEVGVRAPGTVLDGLLKRDLGPYVDFVARDSAGPPPFPVPAAAAGAVISLHRVGDSGEAPAERWVVALPDDPAAAEALFADLAAAAPVLRAGLIAGGMADVRCGDKPVQTFLNPETLDTIAIVRHCDRPVTAAPETPAATQAVLSSGEILVRVPAPEGRYAQGVEVVGARKLSVREIIARHQAAAARQRRQIRQLISTGHMTLTFEAPAFPAPVTITTDATMYTEGGLVEIEQRSIRVNGVAFQEDQVPRLPLLEPERVVSVPLAIALTDVYRYSLDGEDVVAGVKCYVVRFEPVDRRRSLFAGRAWISADEFAMLKVRAVQTALRGPIVASEQTDDFRRGAEGIWLLARSDVHQIYEGAGHRTPIQRVLTIDRHEVNPEGFSARRLQAYASRSVMLRDTPEGFRYLRREAGREQGGAAPVVVMEKPAERVRTIAVGVILDPNITRPLPFAGLSYVDFNLFGTGAQMNGFFGGTFGQLAVAVPSLGGTRWQAAGRAFGIASSYNDRAFVEGREQYRANIAQRPAHVSAWLLRPLTARVTARAGYEFDFNAYRRVESTAPGFVVPSSQRAHTLRLGLEGQWSGWSAQVWWAGSRRQGWRQWGESDGDYRPRQHDYQRFGALVSRSFVFSPRLVARVETAWMSGKDLDRFSRYSFGSFDNRLRGYPSALIRYDRGGALRAAAAWAAGRRLRLDGFFDTAYVRDPGFGRRARSYSGIGAAAEIPVPFGMLAAVEWGYGFQGIDADGRRGTHVIRISGYKMF